MSNCQYPLYHRKSKWKWKSLSCVQLLGSHGLYSLWNSPGQNTGIGNLSLLQGIFPTQGLNSDLPHHRQILYQLSHKGSLQGKKKQENSRKTSTSASLTMLKPLTVWITTNHGKLLKRWEYQTTLPASWKICMQVRKQQLERDMEQWTGSKPVWSMLRL